MWLVSRTSLTNQRVLLAGTSDHWVEKPNIQFQDNARICRRISILCICFRHAYILLHIHTQNYMVACVPANLLIHILLVAEAAVIGHKNPHVRVKPRNNNATSREGDVLSCGAMHHHRSSTKACRVWFGPWVDGFWSSSCEQFAKGTCVCVLHPKGTHLLEPIQGHPSSGLWQWKDGSLFIPEGNGSLERPSSGASFGSGLTCCSVCNWFISLATCQWISSRTFWQ